MGCSLSAEAPDRRPEQEEEEDAVPVSLSAESREAIRSSWKEIQEDISRVGVIMFVRLFETHPECKDAFFAFRDLNDVNALRASKELKAHGLRIMYIIEKTVARIDQDDRLDQLILDLGRKHYQYKALPKYYDLMGEEFIQAIHPVLQERWTSDLEEAWKDLRPDVLRFSSTFRLVVLNCLRVTFVLPAKMDRAVIPSPCWQQRQLGCNELPLI
ncbi:neuroglobin isoform X1 [Oreochromis niloticus]|uniref:neuroglobin isoform X1 n=1 Tax=Oreochromis niloticus TaxID=8128 RepID=UPI000393ED6D|nr:neuroglobin isoform X1 [Oreochromis niloticus]CAI5684861.1 unnamed protein product [Mustela putorius furo]